MIKRNLDGIDFPQSSENHQTTQMDSKIMHLHPTLDVVNPTIEAGLTSARADTTLNVHNDVPNILEHDKRVEKRRKRHVPNFLCNVCHSTFANPYNRNIHIREQHGIGKTPFKCLFCEKQRGEVYFKSSRALTNHQNTVHPNSAADIILPSSTSNDMDVSQHVSNITNPSPCLNNTSAWNAADSSVALDPRPAPDPVQSHQVTPVTPNQISIPFDAASSRQLCKMTEVNNTTKAKFHCRFCRSPFTRRAKLKRHEQIQHTGSSIYQCNDCPKELGNVYFSSYRGRLHHKYFVHEKRGVNELFLCKFCLSPFTERYSLQCHEGMQHGTRNHLCTQCPEELGQVYFASLKGLRNHQNSRHVRKSLVSDGKNGNAEKNRSHSNASSASNQFPCKWGTCQYIGATKSHLRNHVARKHFSEAVWKCRETNCNKFCGTKHARNVHEHRVHNMWK